MKTVDLTTIDVQFAFYLSQKAEANETIVLLLPEVPNPDYRIKKQSLERYDVIYNEYEGGFYLGNDENPYLYLFKAKDDIETLRVHPRCRYVSDHALYEHPNLKVIECNPEIDLDFGDDSFNHCPKLESVLLQGEGEYHYGSRAFASCPNLKAFRFPLNHIAPRSLRRYEDVFKGTPIEHVFLPKELIQIPGWFDEGTKVYCEEDPSHILTATKEEEVTEPYYDYYHPGGTYTSRTDIHGGENYVGPITREEYLKLYPEE